MYKDYEIKLNAILDKHGVQKVELKDVKTIEALIKEGNSLLKKTETQSKNYSKKLSGLKQEKGNFENSIFDLDSFAENELPKNLYALRQAAEKIGVRVEEIDVFKKGSDLRKKTQSFVKTFEKKLSEKL